MDNGYSPRGGFGTTFGGGDRGGNYAITAMSTPATIPQLPQPAAPQHRDPESCARFRSSAIQQKIDELGRFAAASGRSRKRRARSISLIQEMQRLDPRRFPGNPALVEQLHAQVLNDVDKLELQLAPSGRRQIRPDSQHATPPRALRLPGRRRRLLPPPQQLPLT